MTPQSVKRDAATKGVKKLEWVPTRGERGYEASGANGRRYQISSPTGGSKGMGYTLEPIVEGLRLYRCDRLEDAQAMAQAWEDTVRSHERRGIA